MHHASTRKAGEHQEETRLKVDVLGLSEVRWLDSEKVLSGDYTLIYAGQLHKYTHRQAQAQVMKLRSSTVI